VHVLVGTVGRIYDLASKGACDLSHVTTLVLDECDKLLSSEFSSLLEEILTRLNREVQIMLFSATFPMIIKQFKDKYIKNAHEINLMDDLTLIGVTQYYAFITENQKVHCLNTLFSKLSLNQAIIFCNSALRVELLAKKITELG